MRTACQTCGQELVQRVYLSVPGCGEQLPLFAETYQCGSIQLCGLVEGSRNVRSCAYARSASGVINLQDEDTRLAMFAAYLTPWLVEQDSGLESNRPCLVGAWFRAVPGEDGGNELHMTVQFRSHDYLAAVPQNLGACCMWLVDEAKRQGMAVGTITCLSMSAHVYANGWEEAERIVKAYKRKGLRWDQRSNWMVERVLVKCEACDGTGKIEAFRHEEADLGFGVSFIATHRCSCGMLMERDADDELFCPDQDLPTGTDPCRKCAGKGSTPGPLRATALTPNGDSVIGVFEAATGGALQIKIEDSGLLQEFGSAMWLGSEIERIERGGQP